MENGTHIRIKDIAEKAGCSIGTVDRVIHNRGKVSKEVRKRILQIMEELNYKPNVNARVLASKRPLNLGILLPSFKKGEYWELPNSGIREAIEKYAEQGYRILPFFKTYHNPEEFYNAGMKFVSNEIDGIIMNPATFKESVRLSRAYFQSNIPYILIDSDIQGMPSLSFIGKDPIQSGITVGKLTHQITRHIPGKKTIWIINLANKLSQMYSLLGRETGFMSYFADKGQQDQYSFRTFDMEDLGSQKENDRQVTEMLKEGVPNAIYVTGSRVYHIAAILKKIKLDPKPLLIGHDLIGANAARVGDESIDFLIEEEARRQGYIAVESMIRSVIHKEKIAKKQMMKLLIYTKENLPSDSPDQR